MVSVTKSVTVIALKTFSALWHCLVKSCHLFPIVERCHFYILSY